MDRNGGGGLEGEKNRVVGLGDLEGIVQELRSGGGRLKERTQLCIVLDFRVSVLDRARQRFCKGFENCLSVLLYTQI